jgi:deoxyhypusine synthase
MIMMAKSKRKDDLDKAKEYFLKPSVTLDGWPEVKGFDFNDDFSWDAFIESLNTTGFQAHNLYMAILIAKKMQDEKASIFLGYTSNMVSSGLREQIRWLVEHEKVHLIATTAGGVEEDIIKCLKPFVLGSYDAKGRMLRDEGINRTGNIFIPNDRYVYLERFLNKFFLRMLERQNNTGEILSESQLLYHLGFEIKDEKSILFWASKNNIPYFCPGLYDGALGDVLYFFKKKHPEFIIDSAKDSVMVHDIAIRTEKAGIIALGGSAPKHLIANINQFRDGADYAIIITTAQEYEGSNAGANIEESISWGKVKPDAKHVKIVSEATLVFPIFVKAAFVDYHKPDS